LLRKNGLKPIIKNKNQLAQGFGSAAPGQQHEQRACHADDSNPQPELKGVALASARAVSRE
jgi:hypothetical protein